MIVDPDFLEHWKTRMLTDILGEASAPLYVIRLWGHCQNRREWVFAGMPKQAVKAICRHPGDAEELESALITCGFLEREDDQITVVGWDEHNATLIANWTNGMRGGRPKKNPSKTRQEPMGLPADNPPGTDKIGLDKIGLDKTNLPEDQQADSEPAVISLPTNKSKSGEVYPVTDLQIVEWKDSYPACNVLQELKTMKSWLDANKARRKTYGGIPKFINSWLARSQNSGGTKGLDSSNGYYDPMNPPIQDAGIRLAGLRKAMEGCT